MSRIGRRLSGALGVLGLLSLWRAAPASAATPRPEVEVLEVVEVAGGRAYLSPGVERNVRIGDRVTIGRRSYRVLAQNSKHIVVGLEGRRVRRGQHGRVEIRERKVDTFAQRPLPPQLSTFADKWQAAARPAERQSPKFVPLGVASDRRRNRAQFMLDHSRSMPLSGATGSIDRTRLRAVLHAEFGASRIAFDADAFGEFWHSANQPARRASASRPLLNVRQLELSYRGPALQAGLGRLRYAASTLGMLDGARAVAALSENLSLGAFGGTLPDPLDGRPETDVSRFGSELLWQGLAAAAPANASLTVQGSRFLGRTDERRLTAIFDTYPTFGRFGARAEVNFFDEQNPWNADRTELSALGADASIKIDALRFGATLDIRRPERSYWLAAALPRGYFCVAESQPGLDGSEPCIGGDQRVAASFTTAWEARLWTLDGGATAVATHLASAEQATAFLSFRRRELWGAGHLDAGTSVSSGSLFESAAANLGVGASLLDGAADVACYYRPSVTRYRADSVDVLTHGAGTRLWWAARQDLDVSLSTDVLSGRDVDVLFLQTTLAWRPRF